MADRLDRFTKQARQVLTLAREAALRLNHEHIRPEHLLLGIASEQTCTALQILETLGVDADQIVRTVEATVERGERAPAHKPMLAEATKRVIELAVQEALAMGGGEIGSEHLLLGMVQPPGTVVAGLLHETGVTAEQMRTQVARVRLHGQGERGEKGGRQAANQLDDLLPHIRRFVDSMIIPLERDFLSRPFRELLPVLHERRQMVKDLGWWAPALPREVGGLSLSLAEFGRVSEELGRTPLGHFVFNCQAPDIGNMELLLAYGTDEQKERYLIPLARGEIRSCFSMTEPEHAGSNPTWMSTSAVADGDDYVINGHKWYTTAADGAAFAVVMAVTNPEAESRHARASQIIVPMDTPGVRLVRNISVMGEAGEDWHSHAEIVYTDVRVPQRNRVGEEGAGFALAQARLGPGRIHHCMRWIGICERAFDIMCRHAATREVAPGRRLGDQEFVQGWIAESRAEINAARLLVLETARRIDAEGAYAARDDISIIKFHVAGVLQRVLDRALQTLGGLGMCDDTPIAYWYRHERAARIYDGPDEVHKWSVARRILQEYRATLGS